MDHLAEVESDMSVFHRVEDVYIMRADTFFRRAQCLPAYEGAVWRALKHLVTARDGRMTAEVARSAAAAQDVNEEGLWAAYRQQKYAKFLAPGEVPKTVSVAEGFKLAGQALAGG